MNFTWLHTVLVHEQPKIYEFIPLLSITLGCSQFFMIQNNAWVNIFKLTTIRIYLVFKFRFISLGCFLGSESTRQEHELACGSLCHVVFQRFFRIKGGRG